MNLDQLDTFLRVAECGNYHRAADLLHVTQSTVSARIRALEQALGRRLFERGRGGARLTPAGEQFVAHARNLTRGWRQARQTLALPPSCSDTLRVSMQPSLASRLLPDWLTQLRERAPGVAVYVDLDYSKGLFDQLAAGTLDLALAYSPRHAPGVRLELLCEEALVMLGCGVTRLAQLHADNYVYVDWSDALRGQHAEALPQLHASFVSSGISGLIEDYLRQRGGAAYFQRHDAERLLAGGDFQPIADAPPLRQPIYAAWREALGEPVALLEALAGLRQQLRD